MKLVVRAITSLSLLTVFAGAARAANVSDLGFRITAANFRNGTNLYTIGVANAGPQTTSDTITLTLRLPAGFTFLSGGGSSFSCSAAGTVVSCVRTAPMALGSVSFPMTVDVCSTVGRVSTSGSIAYVGDDNLASNTGSRDTSVRLGPCNTFPTATPAPVVPTPTHAPATATSAPASTRTSTPTATASATAVSAAPADVAMSLLRASTFRAGGSGVYFLIISNQGLTATTAPLTASLELPPSLNVLDGSGPGWSCGGVGQLLTCTLTQSLAGKTTTSITARVRVSRSAPPTVLSAAFVDYANDTDTSDNASPRTTPIRR